MSNHLTVATIIEKNRIASEVVFLEMFEVDVVDPATREFVETLRFCRNNENIVYQGEEYVATQFDYDLSSTASQIPTFKLIAKDYTKTLQARMEAYKGAIGFTVRFLVVNTGNLAAPPEMLEVFEVIAATAADYVVTFELGAENPLRQRFPWRRQFKDRCPFRFKGAQCGYTGPLTSCDFTLNGINGCAAHDNVPNFGGFPGISSSYRG